MTKQSTMMKVRKCCGESDGVPKWDCPMMRVNKCHGETGRPQLKKTTEKWFQEYYSKWKCVMVREYHSGSQEVPWLKKIQWWDWRSTLCEWGSTVPWQERMTQWVREYHSLRVVVDKHVVRCKKNFLKIFCVTPSNFTKWLMNFDSYQHYMCKCLI